MRVIANRPDVPPSRLPSFFLNGLVLQGRSATQQVMNDRDESKGAPLEAWLGPNGSLRVRVRVRVPPPPRPPVRLSPAAQAGRWTAKWEKAMNASRGCLHMVVDTHHHDTTKYTTVNRGDAEYVPTPPTSSRPR